MARLLALLLVSAWTLSAAVSHGSTSAEPPDAARAQQSNAGTAAPSAAEAEPAEADTAPIPVQFPELPIEIEGELEVWPSVEVGVEVRAQDAVIETGDGKRVLVLMEQALFRAAALYSGDRVRARLIHREFFDGYEIYVIDQIRKLDGIDAPSS